VGQFLDIRLNRSGSAFQHSCPDPDKPFVGVQLDDNAVAKIQPD
jgi:hypothetical protein